MKKSKKLFLKNGVLDNIRIIQEGKGYGRSIPDPKGQPVQYFYLEEEQRKKVIDKVLFQLGCEDQ